jgi:hypothetical protein
MQLCAFCGSEFPDDARFCGRCGRAPIATLDAPTTLSSGQARPVPKKEAEEEEERRRRAFLLDLSFFPGGGGQPSAGHVPVVQGTPQVSGVPVAQGTPSSLSGVPNAASLPQSAASPATDVSQGAASPAAAPGPPQGGASMTPTASPAQPLPVGSPHPPQEPPHHGRQVQHPAGKLHVPRSGGSAPARVIGSAPKWLHIALAGLVVIVASGITLAVLRTHPPGGGTITAFSVPTAGSSLSAITAGPDGNLWFTEPNGNKIGRITPGGATTGFSAPTDPASDASGVLTAGLVGTFFPLIQSGGPFVRRTPAW